MARLKRQAQQQFQRSALPFVYEAILGVTDGITLSLVVRRGAYPSGQFTKQGQST